MIRRDVFWRPDPQEHTIAPDPHQRRALCREALWLNDVTALFRGQRTHKVKMTFKYRLDVGRKGEEIAFRQVRAE